MAKETTQFVTLPLETIVEMVMIKGELVYLKVMDYGDALQLKKGKHHTMKKKDGWEYIIYQKGKSQFKDAIIIE